MTSSRASTEAESQSCTETESKALGVLARLRGRLGRIEQRVEKAKASGFRPLRVVGLEWLITCGDCLLDLRVDTIRLVP